MKMYSTYFIYYLKSFKIRYKIRLKKKTFSSMPLADDPVSKFLVRFLRIFHIFPALLTT